MSSAPIREAIVLAGAGDPLRTVAGVPLLVRTILSLQRAGVERCTVVGVAASPKDPRIRCDVRTASTLAPPTDPAPRLVVGAEAVIDEALLRDLQGRARPGEVLEVEGDGARVRIAPGPLVGGNGGTRVRPRAGTLQSAASPPAAVERALLLGLENPRDGYLDRLLHRRLSRPLTRLLLRSSLSPSAVTLIGIGLGVAGGFLLAFPGRGALLAATLLLLASGVVDCSDGELARLRFAESRLGHWLDVAGDTVVHLCVLGGIAARIAAPRLAPGRAVLVVLGAGVLGAFAVITWADESEARRRRVAGWENRLLDRVLSPLTTRDWYVFVLGFALAGRLDRLVPAAAVGAHVFWITTLVVLLCALRRAARGA